MDVLQRRLHLPEIMPKEPEESYVMVHTTNSSKSLLVRLTFLAVSEDDRCEAGAVCQVNGSQLAGRVESMGCGELSANSNVGVYSLEASVV